MLHIGITGGIGGGKSTVCRIFQLLGVPIFDADTEAKVLMQKDPDLVSGIKKAFGPEIYSSEGHLDRAALAKIVFHKQEALEHLNALVHPAALQAYQDWSLRQSSPYVIKEAAILFESGSYKYADYTLLVTAPEAIRVARVMERDQVSAEAVRARMDKQMPEDEKSSLADFVLMNDGKQALIPQVMQLHQRFLKESGNA